MILLTGGTGHLGTELLPLLAARGIPVRVLTRDIERARRRVGPVPELVEGDARHAGSLGPAFEDVDTVISAMTGFGPGGDGSRVIDYEGNVSLIRAAEAAGVRKFVLLSMCGAAAEHPMELMRMKHRAEQALRTSTLDWTIVRPNVFMELWVGIVGDPIAKSGKAVVFGRGDNPINFNSATDVAHREVEAATGRKAAVRHVPLAVMRMSRLLLKLAKPDLAGMIEGGISFDTLDMSFDSSELQKRFPEIQLTLLADVVRTRYGVPPGSLLERVT